MPLNINDLANAMESATQNITIGSTALTSLGNSIANYLLSNTLFNFSWTATNTIPPYEPDSVVTGTGKFISLTITLSLSNADNQSGGLSHLASEITLGVRSGQYNMDAPFSTAPATWSDIPDLSIVINAINNRNDAYIKLATDIITWITGNTPATPCTGTRTTYSGSGTVTTVT